MSTIDQVKEAIDFVVDIESNRLPSGVSSRATRGHDGTIGNVSIDIAKEEHVKPVELAMLDKHSNKLTALTFSDVHTPQVHDLNVHGSYDSVGVFNGQKQKVKIFTGTTQTRSDIEKLFKASNSKGKTLKQSQVDHYFNKVFKHMSSRLESMETYYEITGAQGKHALVSSFSSRYFKNTVDELHKLSLDNVSRFVKVSKKSKVMQLDEFQGKYVNEFAKTIIDAANKKGSVNIGAWNAQFESERLSGWVSMYAQDSIKKDWFRHLESGAIKFKGMESSYVNVMYGLAKEDKNLLSAMRIPFTPDAFHQHGYRAGMIPRNKAEFESAVPWSQDLVTSSASGWLKKIKDTSGITAHDAPIDTVRADMLKTFFDKVQNEAISIIKSKDSNISTMDHFFDALHAENSNGRTVMHEAFNNVLRKESKAGEVILNGKSTNEILTRFKDVIRSTSSKRSDIIKDILTHIEKEGKSGGGGGGKPPINTRNISKFFSGMSKENKYGYGILAAMAGMAIASTYLTTDSDHDGGYGSSFGKIGNRQAWGTNFKFEDDNSHRPYLHHNLDSFLYNVAGVYGGVSLLGYRASKLNGKLLGFTGEITDKSPLGLLKQSGKLFRYGIREIEDHFPITRVFKAGASIDYIVGNFNKNASINKGFNSTFKNVDNQNLVGDYETGAFFDAIKKSNPREADELNKIIENFNSNGKVKKAKLNIRSVGNKSSVQIEYETADGIAKRAFTSPRIFDVETVASRTSRANIKGRNLHPSDRALDNTSNRVRSSLTEDYIQSGRFRRNEYKLRNFQEFESQFSKPLWANDTLYNLFRKAQFHLELGPKGINQSSNMFITETFKNKAPKGATIVKSIGGESTIAERLKVKGEYYGQFGNEFIQAANRFLESPFELMINPQTIERATNKLLNSRNTLSRVSGKIIKAIEHPHLGLNINSMKYGTPEYLVKFGLKRVLPAVAAYHGVKALDSLLGGMMFTSTGRGPITSAPNMIYQKAALAYAKVSDILGLTTIAKKQEEFAPGSTGAGFFAIPATMMGTYAVAQGIYNKSPRHLQEFLHKDSRIAKTSLAKDIFSRFSESSLYKEVMRKEAYKGALNKSMLARATETLISHPKASLFGVGVALMSPFLLGFLGSSKSYQERKAEFAGQKDVAIRKNRGWLMSGQAIGGESIQQFRQHGSYIYQSNYENRGVIWPSYTARLLHTMTLGLANRYVLEEYHKEDQPVYESAPYGASVPIVGPMISKTLGWLAKPIRRMHTEALTGLSSGSDGYSPRYIQIARQGASDRNNADSPYFNVLDNKLPRGISFTDLASHSDLKQHTSSFFSQITELVGFKGFVSKAIYQSISGQDQPDSYRPYLKSAMEMYNPSQFMWQYQAGDFSFPGGEFMRRGLQNPRKRWEIDNIPNELYGQSWLPKKYQTGTTFDKMPMGWLYASRKGWEFQYEELRGKHPEDYPDNIKLDILKYMAPNSKEFLLMSKQVNRQALSNTLTPFEEQRAYDAVEQRALLDDKLGATARKNTYALKEKELNGVITSLDLSNMTFTLDNQGDRKYRLAGISVDANDIRNKLLKENHYNNAEDLAKDAEKRQNEIISLIESQMSIGSRITLKTADTDSGNFSGKGDTEAVIGSLNRKLIDIGSPLINTGNLSQYNLSQEAKPIGSGILSSYWEGLTNHTNLFGRKLLGSSDYLNKYEHEQVYNRKVKLWNKPIEHFLLPLVSSMAKSFGFSAIPASVKHERSTEQYWDIIKYIKYKKLQGQAADEEEAEYYQSLSERTLVGADPINNKAGAKQALSYNKQDYFEYFANEPDAKKRGRIMNVVSNAEKRIYSAIWTANLAKGGNKDLQEKYRILQETGGYDIDKSTIEDFKKDSGFNGNLKDYVRARYISQYLKSHKLPGLNWEGWDKNVDIDNTEIHALLSEGEQVQDYGYFEQQKRQAAYDQGAYIAAQHMRSSRLTSSEFTGTVLPMLMSRTGVDNASALPTDSPFPISSTMMTTDTYGKHITNTHNMPAYAQGGISNYFM